MPPGLRKFALTLHILASVGWLGAVVGFLALAITGLTNQDVETVRAVYLAMELTARLALVPLSLASLLTGLIQSLGTPWGLFRHYWVVAKLLINLLASAILLLYTQTLSSLARVVMETTWSAEALAVLRSPTAVLHAGAGGLLLLLATVLSVYKPRGLTHYGWRKQQEQRKVLTQ